MPVQTFRLGFTLAEVLVTLAIIGVVAALTIPTLMANHRKKVVETKLVKMYSTLFQALTMSQVDNGYCTNWEWGDANMHRDGEYMEYWYNKYLKDYMKNVSSTKVQNTSSQISGNGSFAVFFEDGTSLQIEAIPGNYIWFVFDLKGDPAKKSQFAGNRKNGVDIFTVYFHPQTPKACKLLITPFSNNLSIEELYEKCKLDYENGGKTSSAYGRYCGEIIMRNGWKIPDDYPVKI